MSLNRIVIMGRLGADPELRTTPNGVEVATVNLAVERDRKDQNGNRQTDWITVVAWKGTATFLAQYFAKGRMAVVEGRLQLRDWTDKEGGKRRAAQVVADNVYFGDAKRDGEGSNTSQAYGAPAGRKDDFAQLLDDDGELPF